MNPIVYMLLSRFIFIPIDINRAKVQVGLAQDFGSMWGDFLKEPPPDDPIGKVVWHAGALSKSVISGVNFPATLALFLMEESAQSLGMGGYMLASARAWEELEDYMETWKMNLGALKLTASELAWQSPMMGAATNVYMSCAENSMMAFQVVLEKKLDEIALQEENRAETQEDLTKYGTLRLLSKPSNAEIWIDGVNTDTLTPETFRKIGVGSHVIELRNYSLQRETTDVYVMEVSIRPGGRKELLIIIPKGVTSEIETSTDRTEEDTKKYPEWITAEVNGEYALDGDTFETSLGERIRILGIDAPELGRPFAQEAKDFLMNEIEDKKIQLRIQTHKPIEEYGRTLAVCNNYKGTIGIALLSAGLARVFIMDSDILDPKRYRAAEDSARKRKVGIWKRSS